VGKVLHADERTGAVTYDEARAKALGCFGFFAGKSPSDGVDGYRVWEQGDVVARDTWGFCVV